MDLRQLEYFVAVAEEANFTRAAARCHISQSGVSAQIRQLERELGTPLFDRTTRRASLTPAGHAALDQARATLAAAAGVQQAVAEVSGLLRGRLALGMVVGCTVTPLFDAIAAFHTEHPDVEVSIREDNSETLLDDVHSGALDAALVGTAGTPPADLRSLTITEDRLVAVVSPTHPLAGRTRIRLSDLAAHRVICMPRGTGIRDALDRSAAAIGVSPTIAVAASAGEAIIGLAGRGLGVGVLSSSMVRDDPRVRSIVITDAGVPSLLGLAWRTETSPAVRAFVQLARQSFGLEGS
jgi:DNA-binding transcriptional LysR family regulator